MTDTGQPRIVSALETVTSTVIGYAVAIASQVVVFPRYGIHVPLSANLGIGAWFTVISIVRGYGVRRLFNWLRPWLNRFKFTKEAA